MIKEIKNALKDTEIRNPLILFFIFLFFFIDGLVGNDMELVTGRGSTTAVLLSTEVNPIIYYSLMVLFFIFMLISFTIFMARLIKFLSH